MRIVSSYYGKQYSAAHLKEITGQTNVGVSIHAMCLAAEELGFVTKAAKATFDELFTQAIIPFIAYLPKGHFLVVYELNKNKVKVSDPGSGLHTLTKAEFMKKWVGPDHPDAVGKLILLEPSNLYFIKEDEPGKKSFTFFFKYLKPYKKYISQIVVGLLTGTLIMMMVPILTQSIVDIGIGNQDVNFVTLILIGQLVLFISSQSVGIIRSWLLLHITSRLNVSIISDFLIKLLRLPVSFFSTKNIGDLLQRIGDHQRIENFMSNHVVSTVFSMLNLLAFSVILFLYHSGIFAIFLLASIVNYIWLVQFLKKRKDLDYKRFDQQSLNQTTLIQMISGFQEIKLYNAENVKRWEWENIQAQLFKTNIKNLELTQFQQNGLSFINELKNIVILFISASSVIRGDLTLGMMLSIQYMIGQLNTPIYSLVGLIHAAQDAKISIERINEVHGAKDDDNDHKIILKKKHLKNDLILENVNFRYGKADNLVIKDANCVIPYGKKTAIVGASGCGKSTLLKLLLKFHEPESGHIKLGKMGFAQFRNSSWRNYCGAVMQDGYIFSDSIARNIVLNQDNFDVERLVQSLRIANLYDFVESLPNSFNERIGSDGIKMSEGQRQRVLIARAVYKDPEFIFFDEATNSLDTKNERVITDNLNEFFMGKTVVVVAHRLSTIKDADLILVMDDGQIVEQGDHSTLLSNEGFYWELVENQIEFMH